MRHPDKIQNAALDDITSLRRRKQADRFQDDVVTEISGDRRSRRRYPLDLQVGYKIIENHRVGQEGSGKTVDMSGTGIAFETEDVLEIGSSVELSIAWPVLLHKTCPLKLSVNGTVVRRDGNLIAIRVARYEFRTKGLGTLRTMAASSPFYS